MKGKIIIVALAVLTLVSTNFCFATSIPVTVVNNSKQNMYLTATETPPVGDGTQPALSPMLNYGASGDFTKVNNSTIMLAPGATMAFTADDTYSGPYSSDTTGISGGRIYASAGEQLNVPDNCYIPVMGNSQTFGYLEMTYVPNGKTCDLSNVDSFEPVRFQIQIYENGSPKASQTATYYDTYTDIYNSLKNISASSVDSANSLRINSPKDNPTAWANTLTQEQINNYFSTEFKTTQTLAVNYSNAASGGYYTLSYDCVYNNGVVTCTKTANSKPGPGWNGSTPASTIKLYVAKAAPGGGQLTPSCIFSNTAPPGQFFYTYDGTLGNIGDSSDIPGSVADMACIFVSDELLAPAKIASTTNSYSGVIDKNSDAYSKPTSDAGPRQKIVLKKLDNASAVTITILPKDFKSPLTPPNPNSGQAPINNGPNQITAVFYFTQGIDDGKQITYNGVTKTLSGDLNFNTKLPCTFGQTNKWPVTFGGNYATLQVDIAKDGTMSNPSFDSNPTPVLGGGNININFSE